MNILWMRGRSCGGALEKVNSHLEILERRMKLNRLRKLVAQVREKRNKCLGDKGQRVQVQTVGGRRQRPQTRHQCRINRPRVSASSRGIPMILRSLVSVTSRSARCEAGAPAQNGRAVLHEGLDEGLVHC